MKNILVFLLLVATCHAVAQQTLPATLSFPAINDLGSDTYKGFTGGLYPDGKNEMPESYAELGMKLAHSVVPVNGKGVVCDTGRIVFLSTGMSNTTMEFKSFMTMADAMKNLNNQLSIIDGAIGGYDIKKITHPATDYWQKVNERLEAKGYTRHQVQVVWFKEAEAGSKDNLFPDHPERLKLKYRDAIRLLSVYFPNLKMVYLSSRIYGGYATVKLNPEPYAYYSGWSVKWLIEDEINKLLCLSGCDQESNPFLAWGPYLWADGTNKRADGTFWALDDFVERDRTHPSKAGTQKVANMLLEFFTTDPTAKIWFLGN